MLNAHVLNVSSNVEFVNKYLLLQNTLHLAKANQTE
jgi:hypothetical protein